MAMSTGHVMLNWYNFWWVSLWKICCIFLGGLLWFPFFLLHDFLQGFPDTSSAAISGVEDSQSSVLSLLVDFFFFDFFFFIFFPAFGGVVQETVAVAALVAFCVGWATFAAVVGSDCGWFGRCDDSGGYSHLHGEKILNIGQMIKISFREHVTTYQSQQIWFE